MKRLQVYPFFKAHLADLETPLSCYYKLKNVYTSTPSFLLESVESAGRLGRYSFIGFDPFCVFKTKGKKVIIEGEINKEFFAENPFEVLREFMKNFIPHETMEELRFSGGAVGYVGYDIVRFFERLPDISPYNLNIFDMYFMLPKKLVIFDNFTHKMTLVSLNYLDKPASRVLKREDEELNRIHKILKSPIKQQSKNKFSIGNIKNLTNKKDFEKMVEKAKEYICNGDIIQVVLSQRFKADVSADGLDLYRALRVINPSPYMFFLDFCDYSLIGSSPEILVRLENNEIEVRPIAGTRKRGRTLEEDRYLEEELLNDKKECAEHVMLVDLGRNDIGRIAKIGSVTVPEFMIIERYSHVMHIVSSVKGILKEGMDAFDVFKATFPAGTVTGAPKIRAMEIIEELESLKREFYAGGVGYFGFNGNMDFCITIRTMLKKGKTVYMQAGAGIVADSVPENEYNETLNKAMALMKSITDLKEILE
ncbi:MAG: anthranilate synthase component I [Proteobacteria bacterium]|nr:anthranilate synthase component I [Pseudomonadota bacterium]